MFYPSVIIEVNNCYYFNFYAKTIYLHLPSTVMTELSVGMSKYLSKVQSQSDLPHVPEACQIGFSVVATGVVGGTNSTVVNVGLVVSSCLSTIVVTDVMMPSSPVVSC